MPDVLVWNVIKTHIIWNVLVVQKKKYEPIAIRKAHVNFILILVRQRIMLQSGNFQ